MDIWRKWRNPRLKPPFGARIDWSDPITEGLAVCYIFQHGDAGITPCDLVSGSIIGNVKGADRFEAGALRNVSGGWFSVSPSIWLYPELPFTEALSVSFNAIGTEGQHITYVGPLDENGFGGKSSRGLGYGVTDPKKFKAFVDYAATYTPSTAEVVLDVELGRHYSLVVRADSKGVVDLWVDTVSAPGAIDTSKSVSVYKECWRLGRPGTDERYFQGYYYYYYLWWRLLHPSEIERLYYEPYSFFLAPAARIFDLAPASGFTTTQDITWRLFTSKENQIIYNILTDKQASFGYKIFDRKDNSITYRIFTQDGSSFTWKILASSSQDISYRIFTRLQSELSWAIASTALSQAITYKIFTRNEVNISWLILTAEATSLDWSIFTTKEQQAIWNILAQTETDLLWDIYTRKDATLAYKIFKDINQDLIYKIFNSTEQDLVWKILAAGLLSEILSWKIFAKQEDTLSWKVFSAEQQELFYKIFNVKEDEITWLIKREDAADLSWKLFNLKEDPILWKIYSQAEKTLAWSILAALTSQDIYYKIFTIKDEELFYNIVTEASKSLDWKIYNEKGEELTWRIISEIVPEPTYHIKASKRVFVINPTRGIIITKE